MERVEFRTTPQGVVYYTEGDNAEKRLTKFSTALINRVLETIRDRFPECYARLAVLYGKEEKSERPFVMADRFIRCNFGSEDHLTPDIEGGIFNFEEIKCPLRGGFCPDEGVICKPKGVVNLSHIEQQTVKLYINGYTFKEIAGILHKNPSTVKTQLWKIKKKLGVRNCREIIKILRLGNM